MSQPAVKDQKHKLAPGDAAPYFSLKGTDGKSYSIGDVRGSKGVVVIFMCNHCPYVKGALDRIIKDMNELKALGIGSVAISSNDVENYPEDNFENMQRLAASKSLPFPYLFDETQDIARAFDAATTPEFYGFDSALKLVYHGRLDSAGNKPLPPEGKRELFEAMKAVAEGGKPSDNQQPSIGCSIKWKS
jgi:peroxiredoxin